MALDGCMPWFPGGEAKLYQILIDSMRYPAEAAKMELDGRAVVTFQVLFNGEIGQARIVESTDTLFSIEALRVVKTLPKFNPYQYTDTIWFTLPINFKFPHKPPLDSAVVLSHGGVVKGSVNREEVAMVFTADSMFEGVDPILLALERAGVKGAFFFTQYMLNNHPDVVWKIKNRGHYVSHHGYNHKLYCDWENRDSTLISRDEFMAEMDSAYRSLGRYDISRIGASVFIPPFEWYNDSICAWASEQGLQVVSYTYGFPTSEDYTVPSMGEAYVSTDEIFKRLRGMPVENGTIFLIHMGVKPERPEPLYDHVYSIIDWIDQLGYKVVPLMELISPKEEQ